MNSENQENQIRQNLLELGVRPGGVLMVHSSLKSMGHVNGGAETVIRGLLDALGPGGTLLMPALSYENVNEKNPLFDVLQTPVCVGAIPEYFRKRKGSKRSIHPTHSVCGTGFLAERILAQHHRDHTPCGSFSPFHILPEYNGQILMLGCGLKPNTSMHAIEEKTEPPYLFGDWLEYELVVESGRSIRKSYLQHNFKGWEQRYERIQNVVRISTLKTGPVLSAESFLIEAESLWQDVLKKIKAVPEYFVDKIVS
ncbi:AAC(3) family N-acetyltransferase [candidate division KSB1 bacterium]|nr:AAC(3) family N-acetyltransferase [candidate division KSB1 bacterium]